MNAPKIHINIDNITEILGYYHHEISQHTNDINSLKQSMHTLAQKNNEYEKNDSDLPLFISSSNARLESFAASIHSLSQQMVMMEDSLHKIRHQFDAKISALTKHINELETQIQINSSNSQFRSNESAEVFIPDSQKIKDDINTKSLIKKSSKKKKLTNLKERLKYQIRDNSNQKHTVHNQKIDQNESKSSLDDTRAELETLIQSNNKALMEEISHLKRSIRECKSEASSDSFHGIFNKRNKETDAEFADIHNKLDSFVTHDELDKLLSDEMLRPKTACLSNSSSSTSTLIIPDRNKPRAPIQTPRKTVHVTLINGETLSDKRQKQLVKQKYTSTTPNIAYSKKWNSIYE